MHHTPWNYMRTKRVERGPVAVGRVRRLMRSRFAGYIRTDDGRLVFFHGRDVKQGRYAQLDVDAPVQFELIDDRLTGPRARRVLVKEEQPGA